MNLLSGDGLVAWSLVLDDAIWTSVFGGSAAGGSLWLAQQDRELLEGGSEAAEAAEAAEARSQPLATDPPSTR